MAVEKDLHTQITSERQTALPDAHNVQLFRDYTAGKQPLTLTKDQREIVAGLLKRNFCDNGCRRVVSTVANRTRVDRMDVPDTAVEKWLKDFWALNWMRQLQARVHYSAVRDGNAYVSLDFDNVRKRVVPKRELAWNGQRGVFIAYDEYGQPEYGVKEWTQKMLNRETGKIEEYKRRVVWEPGRIGRFILKNDGWDWFPLDPIKDAEGNIIRPAESADWQPWTDKKGQPLGIPCIHFARMESPVDDPRAANTSLDAQGVSILDGGVLGIQDVINDDHWTIIAANRFTGYKQMYATGVSLTDSQGQPVKLKLMPGTLIHVEDENAKFGAIEAGDLSQLQSTLETHHTALARATATPIHVISGEWPSGVALIEADRPLIEQAISLADSFGPAWASVMHRATQISNAFGGTDLDTSAVITTVFQSPESSDKTALAAYAAIIAPFVSIREVHRTLRFDQAKSDQIIEEMKDEAGFEIQGAGQTVTEKSATGKEPEPGKPQPKASE